MQQDRPQERTATDERVAENRTPAPHVSLTGHPENDDPGTGLPLGTHRNDKSPLDWRPFRSNG